MNWVAVDLGKSTIKATVLDKSNRPIRLSYPMGSYATTLFPSAVALTEEGNVVLGDYALQFGMYNPKLEVKDWYSSTRKTLIARAIFERIKQASIKHYSDSNIGIVLLHNNIEDPELRSIAETVFSKDNVKTMHAGEVFKRTLSPNSKLMLIADFGESAFRVILQEETKCLYNERNERNATLGFSSIEMLPLIDPVDLSSHNSVDKRLLGQIMQRIKILVNNGEDVILPHDMSAKGNSLANSFEQKMTTFLYQCFDECTNALKTVSKSWKNVEEVVFVGGGAHSNIIDTVFNKYIQSHGTTLVSYNSKNIGFDAQYATANCAILAPELKEVKGVVVEL